MQSLCVYSVCPHLPSKLLRITDTYLIQFLLLCQQQLKWQLLDKNSPFDTIIENSYKKEKEN